MVTRSVMKNWKIFLLVTFICLFLFQLLYVKNLTIAGITKWAAATPTATIWPSSNTTTNSTTTAVKRTPRPLILFYTKWFTGPWPDLIAGPILKCGKITCLVSHNRNDLSKSNAVVFHGSSSDIYNLPSTRNKPRNQIWIFHNNENPIVTKLLISAGVPPINDKFNMISSYNSDSDIVHYNHVVVPGVFFGKKFDPTYNYGKGRTKLISWASSQCYDERTNFVKKLNQHVPISMYGKCGNLKCKGGDCFNKMARDHKFYLSFENYVCKDYVTEKFYGNALSSGMVPIVIGAANYSNPTVAPPHSYINVYDFATVEDLAKYIKKVANNDTLYNSYFKWRSHYNIVSEIGKPTFCNICRKIVGSYGITSFKTYHDLVAHMSVDRRCTSYPDPNNITLASQRLQKLNS